MPSFSTQQLQREVMSFVESVSDGLIFLDRQWRIVYANDSARRISRIEPQHLDGPSHWELYPDTVGTPQEQIYRTSMEQRVSLDHEFYYAPFDVWIALRTVPIPIGIAVHYRDISRLRRAEKTRDETGSQLKQVFDSTSDGIVLLDHEYRLTFLNRRAQELLAPSGDVLGKSLWTAFPGAVYEHSPYVATYRRAMEERLPGSFEAYYPEPLNLWLAVEALPASDGIIVFSATLPSRGRPTKSFGAGAGKPSARQPRSRPCIRRLLLASRSSIRSSSGICA